jgi:transposase InsO family protein
MVLGYPTERWSIDLCGPYCSSDGYKYIFTAICPFTKFAVCSSIRNKEASTVAKCVMDLIICKWGLCFEVLVDQGPEFEADLSKELYKALGISKIRTSGYRPQTNGAIEVYHKVLNSLLAKHVKESQRDWSRWLNYTTFCYNASVHSSTGFSPFFLMTGRQPIWNVDLVLDSYDRTARTVPQHTSDTIDRLEKAYTLTRDHLRQVADTASTWYNKRVHQKAFTVGDVVRVYCPRRYKGRSPKLQSFYKDVGTIQQKLNDVTYIVMCSSWRQNKVVHVDKLKPVVQFE